jgi:hypothetical protein
MKTTARQWTVIAGLTLLALLIRLIYVRTAVVDHPLRGDTIQYFAYALNLVDHGTFSLARPGQTLTADSFRDPGYPSFLALIVLALGREQTFYLTTLDVQCVMSAATVGIYALLTRRWSGMTAAVVVGCGLALWPHMISMSAYLLSETLLGFLFACGLLSLQAACDRNSPEFGVGAGLLFAAAALTNAVLTPLVPIFAFIAAWRNPVRRGLWIAVMVAATVPSAAWVARSATLSPERTASDRMSMNFAQGSWPEYHAVWRPAMLGDPSARAILDVVDSDTRRMTSRPREGMAAILDRMRNRPGHYLLWYLSKPVELWGWSIGIGAGDLFPFPTFNSPLSGTGPLGVVALIMDGLNPFLFIISTIGILVVVSTKRHPPALVLAAWGMIFVTAVFAALQSDARYSTPYRGAEWALAAVGASTLIRLARRRIARQKEAKNLAGAKFQKR